MQKTPFAGLTVLKPDESISADNASFQSQNPRREDRLLEIGAVTHRHNAEAALEDPTIAPSATVDPTGGAIPADLEIYFGYTLRDDDAGETVLSDVVAVSTQSPYDPPSTEPIAEVDYTGGTLLTDTFYYAITLLDATGGETPPSPWVIAEREPGYASGQVELSGLTADFEETGAVLWRLYRARGGTEFDLLDQGSSDTYTDDGSAVANCDVHPPADTANTTNNTNQIAVVVPSGGLMDEASSFRLYASLDGTFAGASLVGEYPPEDAGLDIVFSVLNVEDERPPDVSTCVRGASLIDPDTDILDWHWKRPVADADSLPGSGNSSGDVRLSLDDGTLYGYLDGVWGGVSGGGGGFDDLDEIPVAQRVGWVGASGEVAQVWSEEAPNDEEVTIGIFGPDDFSVDGLTAGVYTILSGSAAVDTALQYLNPIDAPPLIIVRDSATLDRTGDLELGVNVGTGSGWLDDGGYAQLVWARDDMAITVGFQVIDVDGTPTMILSDGMGHTASAPAPSHITNDPILFYLGLRRAGSQWIGRVYDEYPGFGDGDPTGEVVLDTADDGSFDRDGYWALIVYQPGTILITIDNAFAVSLALPTRDLYISAGNEQRLLLSSDGSSDVIPAPREDPIPLTYQPDWSDAGGSGRVGAVWLDHDDVVHLEGVITKSSAPAVGDLICILPTGHYDDTSGAREHFAVVTGDDAGRGFGSIEIQDNGYVKWMEGRTGTNRWVSFEGIVFRAETS